MDRIDPHYRCDSLDDAGRETMRVLKPGGWFVHTICRLDLSLDSPIDLRGLAPSCLTDIFPESTSVATGGGSIVGWIAGRRATGGTDLAFSSRVVAHG